MDGGGGVGVGAEVGVAAVAAEEHSDVKLEVLNLFADGDDGPFSGGVSAVGVRLVVGVGVGPVLLVGAGTPASDSLVNVRSVRVDVGVTCVKLRESLATVVSAWVDVCVPCTEAGEGLTTT